MRITKANVTLCANVNHFQFRVSVGSIGVTWNSRGQISRLDWYYNRLPLDALDFATSDSAMPKGVARWIDALKAYFRDGEPMPPIDWDLIDRLQWSEFQDRVYRAAVLIPHGETRTYSWLARRIGRLDKLAAPRAVGQALRRNPVPILIPCHRIVAADALGGFMGLTDPECAELQFKSWLISHENTYLNPRFGFFESLAAETGSTRACAI